MSTIWSTRPVKQGFGRGVAVGLGIKVDVGVLVGMRGVGVIVGVWVGVGTRVGVSVGASNGVGICVGEGVGTNMGAMGGLSNADKTMQRITTMAPPAPTKTGEMFCFSAKALKLVANSLNLLTVRLHRPPSPLRATTVGGS